jgi:DNA gyrase subunit A
MLEYFLAHRREVITRRTIFELRKARERGHVLEGLAVVLANIDRFIAIIKAAANPVVAKQELMAQAWDSSLVREMLARAEGEALGGRNAFRPEGLLPEYGMQDSGLYRLSDDQAQEILQMRLQRLTGLEQDKIVNEYKEVMDQIADLLDLLAKPERVTKVIETELLEVKTEFGADGSDSGRRSFIEMNATELFTEDLITPTDMVVTLSHAGYMKSQPLSEYRAQKRGGRGKQAAATKDEDWIDTLFVANTHDTILCFSDRGRMYWLKVWEVPQGSRTSRGKPIVNMFPLVEGEKITVILPIQGYEDDHYVFMATRRGTVKKTRLSDFSNPRKAGIIAVDLDEGDFLVGAAITDGKHDVMLFSDAGKAVRFDENDVRPMCRTARGVRGMNLSDGQEVIAMLVAPAEVAEGAVAAVEDAAAPNSVLTATENGYGKRTPIAEYTRHGRGTKGMIAIQTSERNGKVVAAALVSPEDQIMLITTGGVLVRTRVSEIREMGRATQGVTLINVDEGTHLSGLQRIAESDSDEEGDDMSDEQSNSESDVSPDA